MTVELLVYGDESGIDQAPYCVVAGFIASPKHWDSFNLAWRKVIDEAGVSEFHSKLFFDRHRAAEDTENPFAGWPEPKAKALLEALIDVLRQHARITPIGCALDVKLFNSYTWGERNYLTGAKWNGAIQKFVTQGAPSRAYPIPFYNMVGEALQEAQPPDCKVHFVMDEQKVIENGIQQVYAEARTNDLIPHHEKLGDLTPGRSEDHEGIQAADLLAYTWYGWYRHRERLRGDRLDVLYKIMKAKRRREMGVIRKRGIERIFQTTLRRPEDRARIKALKSPAERQRSRSARGSA